MLSLDEFMPAPRVDRARRILVEWALFVAFGVWFLVARSYIEDDAFIHLEFAKNVDEGRGFAFDGQPVFGDSSPLWVFSLVALGKIGVDLELAIKLLAVAGCGLYVWSIRRLCQRFPERGERVWTYAAITFGVTLNPYVMTWVFSGMESVTAAALATLVVAAALDQSISASRRVLTVAGFTAAGALLRGEIGLLGLGLLGELCMNASFRKTGRRARLTRFAIAASLALAPLAVWMVYAKLTLGSFMPTTHLTQRFGAVFSFGGWLDATARLCTILVGGYGVPLTAAIACIAPRWRELTSPQDRPLRIALGWAVGLCAFYVVNRSIVQSRDMLLLTPSIIVILITALRRASAYADKRPLRAAVGVIVVATLYLDLASVLPLVLVKDRYVARVDEFTSFLQNELDPTWPIAIYNVGQVAYQSPQPIVDTGGVMRPSVPKLPWRASEVDTHALVAWSKAQGARCFAPGDPQDAEQTLLYDRPIPDISRTFTPWVAQPDQRLQLRCLKSR
ncbi:MAG: hypothetical protein ABW321_25250 [Polyangiales bacterium]